MTLDKLSTMEALWVDHDRLRFRDRETGDVFDLDSEDTLELLSLLQSQYGASQDLLARLREMRPA